MSRHRHPGEPDIASGVLARVPVSTAGTEEPIGLMLRADSDPGAALRALVARIREEAAVKRNGGERHPIMNEPSGPEREALRGQMRRLLEARIDELPDGYRAVFVLRGVEELSVEETAAALDMPQATVRTRYFRARGLLREALACDIDLTMEDAFGFDGARCDRIVAEVIKGLGLATSAEIRL